MRLLLACLAVAAASVLVVPAAPGYDPWAWLIWGRELAGGALSTTDGPAWKPLPVLVTSALAPAGDLAPVLWVVLARAGAVAALVLAYRVGRRLAGGAAGVLAATGAALVGGLWRHAGAGESEPLLVALLLLAADRLLAGRHRPALAAGLAAALLRPEAWPLVALGAVWAWRRDVALRPLLLAGAAAVPLLWLVPEWVGSGDPLRAGARARVPNPGQPATAEVPALATLAAAWEVLVVPLALAAVAARGPARALATAGAGWVALVALMSQGGFSGEPRYLVPGAVLLAVAGAVAATRLPRPVLALVLAALAPAAAVRARDAASLPARLDHQRALAADLRSAVAAAGGADAVLSCGRPHAGRYRGPLVAWHLGVPKRTVGDRPGTRGVVLRSRLTRDAPPTPAVPGGYVLRSANASWRIAARCG